MKTLSALLVLLATPALAHPGHVAAMAEGQAHWLTEADHIAVVAGIIALAALLAWPKGRAALSRLFG